MKKERGHDNMDAVRKEESYTIKDIYDLPDGERAELIDGQIYYMAPPSTKHQRLLNFISTEINLYIRNNNGECEVFPAPFAVFLNENDKNYVEPDISVICDKDKITDKGCNGRIGLLKLFLPAADRWIIIRSCLNIAQQGYGNIGSLTRISRL